MTLRELGKLIFYKINSLVPSQKQPTFWNLQHHTHLFSSWVSAPVSAGPGIDSSSEGAALERKLLLL